MRYHNIHNHSTYSDGFHTPEQLVRYAYRRGLDVFGISDHFATTKGRALQNDQFATYLQHLKRLKIEWRSKLKVVMGAELDSNTERTDFSRINYSKLNELDYVLVEYVQDPLWKGMAFPEFLDLTKNFKIPVGLAHTDFELCFYEVPHELVINDLERHNIFIELDTAEHNMRNGKPYYRLVPDFFLALKGRNIPLAIGSDTHDDAQDIVNIYDANKFVEELGLEDNLKLFLELFKD